MMITKLMVAEFRHSKAGHMAEAAPLTVDQQLARALTPTLVGRLEAIAMVVQAGGIVTTAAVDQLLPSGQATLFAIAAVHVLFAGVITVWGGPFRWGPQWAALWVGFVFLMPLVMAHLVAPTQYASSPSCVQLCGYPNGVLLLLAFYPWIALRPRHLKTLVEIAVIVALFLEHLAITMALHDGHLTRDNISGITAALLGNSLAYIVGKAIGHMCFQAARTQLERQREDYDEFANFLHSHVRGTLVAVRAEAGDPGAVVDHLQRLDQQVSRRRLQILLTEPTVLVAAIVREHVGRFAKAITISSSPQTGALAVNQQVGILVSRALGDLLSNATQHATEVSIDIVVTGAVLRLDVSDNGPGLDPAIIDDAATSLHGLRRDARRLGGDLTVQPGTGARLRLTAPLAGTRSANRSG
jgi:signal transduction histidine kinase